MQPARRYLRALRRALLAASAISALVAGLSLALPVLAVQLTETALPAAAPHLVLLLAAAAAAALLVAAGLDWCRELILARTGLWLQHTLGPLLIERGLDASAPPDAIEDRTAALATLRAAMTDGRLLALIELPWLLLAGSVVVLLDSRLALAAAAAVTAMLIVLAAHQLATARSNRRMRELDAAAARLAAAHATDEVTVGPPGLAAEAARRWELASRRHVAQAYRSARWASFARAAARAVEAIGLAGLIAFGAWLVIADSLAPGLVVAAALIAARTLRAIDEVGRDLAVVQDAARAWHLLMSASDPASDDTRLVDAGSGIAAAAPGSLVIEKASFCWPGARTPSILQLDFAMAPGECIGIIGHHGAGKSSLAAMIAGVSAPTTGRVLLDGLPVTHLQRSPETRPIAYVPDEPRLFAGTIADNIAGFGLDGEAAAIDAAMRAGVHEMLGRLPDGYSTMLGRDGRGIPMRARRAVALARAVLTRPRVLVLDEPELGLDPSAVAALTRCLAAIRAEGIAIVIATADPRFLCLTDRVVVLSGGTVETVMPTAHLGAVVPHGSARPAISQPRWAA